MPETESLLTFLAHARRRHMNTELVRHGITALLFGPPSIIHLLTLVKAARGLLISFGEESTVLSVRPAMLDRPGLLERDERRQLHRTPWSTRRNLEKLVYFF